MESAAPCAGCARHLDSVQSRERLPVVVVVVVVMDFKKKYSRNSFKKEVVSTQAMVRHVVFGYDNDASKLGLQAVGDRWFDQQMCNGPPLRAHTPHNPKTNRKIDPLAQTNSRLSVIVQYIAVLVTVTAVNPKNV